MTIRYVNDIVKSMTKIRMKINSQWCLNTLPDLQEVKSSCKYYRANLIYFPGSSHIENTSSQVLMQMKHYPN